MDRKFLGMLQAQRIVLLSLVQVVSDRSRLKNILEGHVSDVQDAAAKDPDDQLLFETEAELERFIAVLESLGSPT